MARARDLLQRFRPAGAPGSAGGVGVPADRVAEASAELEPVFALLAGTETLCRDTLSAAAVEAERRRKRASDYAEAVLASTRQVVAAERASAAAETQLQAEQEGRSTLTSAAAEADALRARAEQRLDDAVAGLVATFVARLQEVASP